MHYHSTRQTDPSTPPLNFEQAIFQGLAPDGGLYIPTSIPTFPLNDILSWSNLKYHQIAFRLFRPFVDTDAARGGIPDEDLERILERSFETFTDEDVTPVKPLPKGFDEGDVGSLYVLELFHGPTFAFKDVALQVLGNLFEYFLARRNKTRKEGEPLDRLTVLGATSGDTGGAAIYGLRGKANVDVFILHPHKRISPVQEQQMTSVLDPNVHNVVLKTATFDDCQEVVKRLFGEKQWRDHFKLGAINSINWARILAQTSYYFASYLNLLKQESVTSGKSLKEVVDAGFKVQYSVPTGNFGDVLAGYYALRMGLPIHKLIIATNENDILHRFLQTGIYSKPTPAPTTPTSTIKANEAVKMTLSPAMDILVSSNFERMIWYLTHGDTSLHSNLTLDSETKVSETVLGYMKSLNTTGSFSVPLSTLSLARQVFASERVSDSETKDAIRRYFFEPATQKRRKDAYVLDPHTAVGVVAAERVLASTKMKETGLKTVVLSTASPGKFPEAVFEALGEGEVGYEEFAPRGLLEQRDLPRRYVEVETWGEMLKGVEGVRRVVEGTVGGWFAV
ncbi:threonine synthase [Chytridiales sp. JEL 0842]|nr:threonine synthase [Chytridiales sp. JEL 0842]